MKSVLLFLLVALVAAAEPAYSCRKDTDCGVGRKCISAPGATSGVCIEGELSEVVDGQKKEPDEDTVRQAVKNPCQFDNQCGPGEYCFRATGDTYGICIRK